ncbi:MAG: hypothetical protein ACRDRY_20705 [Pseudonocardiaceae bacterium]
MRGEPAQGGRPRETGRGRRDAGGRHAVAPGGIAAGPQLQLGFVTRGELLAVRSLGEGDGEPLAHRRSGHLDQERTRATRLLG